MAALALALFGLHLFVALVNRLGMPRARPSEAGTGGMVALIPARDEAGNLARLVPKLRAQGLPVIVFDDESSDGTADVARTAGAEVIVPDGPLPAGWTGKNRACRALGLAGAERGYARLLFLDADTDPEPGFAGAMAALPGPVVTGIPRVAPGEGVEPLFLAWVGWLILASNPFGLVARSGLGHNRFLNGQVQVWDAALYARLDPNSVMRDRIMEDVMVGRLLARERVPVLTADLSRVLTVRMYRHWRETLDGFSKNAYEITGSAAGTVLLAGYLVLLAALAVSSPLAYGLAVASAGVVAWIARAPLWPAPLLPVSLLLGAFTLLRSLWWRRTGRTRWKGRVYGG